jgi:non-canonical purine NTP pyrophosphatase (RdgB/HAM1 family)
MSLYLITGNLNKLREVQAILPHVEQLHVDLPEIQEIDPLKIIKSKLEEASKYHDGEFLVEDTSLYFESMEGLPGPLIKWFLQALGNDGLHLLAEKYGNTKAVAKTVIGYYKNKDDIQFVEGVVEGNIVSPRGEARFGWDPIFQPLGHTKTYAEMNSDEKNKMSHRRQALNNLSKLLNNSI